MGRRLCCLRASGRRLDRFLDEEMALCALARRYLQARGRPDAALKFQAFKVSVDMDLAIVFCFVDQAASYMLSCDERRSRMCRPTRSATSGRWPPRSSRSPRSFDSRDVA